MGWYQIVPGLVLAATVLYDEAMQGIEDHYSQLSSVNFMK